MTKMPNKNCLSEKYFILAHHFRGTSTSRVGQYGGVAQIMAVAVVLLIWLRLGSRVSR